MSDLERLIARVKAGELGSVRTMLSENFFLSSQRLSNGESPLMAALYRGHHEIVDTLLESGAEIDVFAAAATGRLDDLQRTAIGDLVNSYSYDGWTPLHLAAFFGKLGATSLLIERGADLDARSRNSVANTPLHAATAGRHADVALLLLEHGASGSALDAGGYTPKQIAQQNQLADVVARIGD